jgi:hypothetical protein
MDLLRRGEVLPPGRSNEEERRLAARGKGEEEKGGKGEGEQAGNVMREA